MSETLKKQCHDDVNLVILEGEIASEICEHKLGKEKYYTTRIHTSNNFINECGALTNFDPTEHKIFGILPWVIRELRRFKRGDRVRIEGKLYNYENEDYFDEHYCIVKDVSIVAHKVTEINPCKVMSLPTKNSDDSPMDFFKEKKIEE